MSVKILNPAVFSIMSSVALENSVVVSFLPVGTKCLAQKRGVLPLNFFTLWGEELLEGVDNLAGYSKIEGIPHAYYRLSEEETFLTKLLSQEDIEALARFIDRSKFSKKARDLLIVCDASWRQSPGSLVAQLQETWLTQVCEVSGSRTPAALSNPAKCFSTAIKILEDKHASKHQTAKTPQGR